MLKLFLVNEKVLKALTKLIIKLNLFDDRLIYSNKFGD